MDEKRIYLVGEKVLLREYIESDIEDFIRWNTSETEWQEWDAPWENETEPPFDAERYRSMMMERLRKRSEDEKKTVVCGEAELSDCAAGKNMQFPLKSPPKSLPTLQICVNDNECEHIGWVNSYFIDEAHRFIDRAGHDGAKDGARLTIGIDIPVLTARGKGYAKEAWGLYLKYARDLGFEEIYTQTWSGNDRALGLIRSLGFEEVGRAKAYQVVRGEPVDGLTFRKRLGEGLEMRQSSSDSSSPGFIAYIVDAFTHQGKGGNKAGVVILPSGKFPAEHTMQNIASKLGFSETAFVVKSPTSCEKGSVPSVSHPISGPDVAGVEVSGDGDSDIADFHIRYFTPTDEVDFCGHATIAVFEVLAQIEMPQAFYFVKTAAGMMQVERCPDNSVFIDMDAPNIIRTLSKEEYEELSFIMRLPLLPTDSESHSAELSFPASAVRCDNVVRGDCVQAKRSTDALSPVIVNAGLTDILLPLRSREELNALKPDFEKLAEFSERLGVVGVHAFVEAGNAKKTKCSGSVIYARNFAPLYGIDEEAATGTSNAGLTQYLYECGRIKASERNTILQGETMNLTSEILTFVSTGAEETSNACVCGRHSEKRHCTENRIGANCTSVNRIRVGGFGTIVERIFLELDVEEKENGLKSEGE